MVLTLWLSMIAAEGLAPRPTRSRSANEEAAVRHTRERPDRLLDTGGIIADLNWDEFDRKCRRCRPGKSPEVIVSFEFWIGNECDASEVRRDILKHREPFAQNAALVLHHPGEIAPGPCQLVTKPEPIKSETPTNTIEIVRVSCFSAAAAGVNSERNTSGWSAASSFASAGY